MDHYRPGLANPHSTSIYTPHRQSSSSYYNPNQNKLLQQAASSASISQAFGRELKTNSASLAPRSSMTRDRVRDDLMRSSVPPPSRTPVSRFMFQQDTPVYRAASLGCAQDTYVEDRESHDYEYGHKYDHENNGEDGGGDGDAISSLSNFKSRPAEYITPRRNPGEYSTPRPTSDAYIAPPTMTGGYATPHTTAGGYITPLYTPSEYQQSQGRGYANLRANPSISRNSSRPTRSQTSSSSRLPLSPDLSPAIEHRTRISAPFIFNTPQPKPRNTKYHLDVTPFGSRSSILYSSSAKQRSYSPAQQYDRLSRQASLLSVHSRANYIEGGGEGEVEQRPRDASGRIPHNPNKSNIPLAEAHPKSLNLSTHLSEHSIQHPQLNCDLNPAVRAQSPSPQEGSHNNLSDYHSNNTSQPSSPEPAPPPKSIPIKDRIPLFPRPQPTPTPARKRAKAKVTTTTTPSATLSPKTPARKKRNLKPPPTTPARKKVKFSEKQQPPAPVTPPEQKRQVQTAAKIISLETAGKDIQLFGEIVETTPERTQRIAREQATLESARQAKEVKAQQAALKAEAKASRERERLREAAEEAERAKKEKELAEEKKKIAREKARKKAAVAEQKELEYKRQLATQKIETDRLKVEMEALQKENARREAEEKARGLKVDADALAKLNATKEVARRQAAKLSAPGKITDAPKEDTTSMFLPDPLSGLRSNATFSSNGQSGFDTSRPIPGIKSFNQIREAIEGKKEQERQEALHLAQEAKLITNAANLKKRAERVKKDNNKVNKFKAVNNIPKTPIAKKAPAVKTARKSVPKAKPSITSKKNPFHDSDEEFEDDDMEGLSIEYPTVNTVASTREDSPASDEDEEPSPGSTQATSPSTTPPNLSGRDANTATPVSKPKNRRQLQNQIQSEKAKAARTERTDARARENKKQDLLKKAADAGRVLSELELEMKLNTFMDQREKAKRTRAKRVQNKAARERAFSSPKVNNDANAKVDADTDSDSDDDADGPAGTSDEVDLEEVATRFAAQAKAPTRSAAQEKRRQASIARGTKFSTIAEANIVADLEDGVMNIESNISEESEEDEDEVFDPTAGLNAEELNALRLEAQKSKEERAAAKLARDLEADLEQAMDEALGADRNTKSVQDADNAEVARHHVEAGQIHIYEVRETPTKNGIKMKSALIQTFVSLAKANARAQKKMLQYRKKYSGGFPSFIEGYDDLQIYSAALGFDQTGQNAIEVKVIRSIRSSDELIDFDYLDFEKRVPAKTYQLRLVSEKSATIENDEHNTKTIFVSKISEIIEGFHYSNMHGANVAASEYAINLLRPSLSVAVEHRKRHAEEISTEIQNVRDQFVECNAPFDVLIDVIDEGLVWIEGVNTFHIMVELFKMSGPLN